MKSLAILGRQPAIGLAELESLYGAEAVRPVGENAVTVNIAPDQIEFRRLGGTVKLAKLLTVLDFTNWDKIEDFLAEELPKHTCCITEGKLTLGLSAYGFKMSPKKLNATALSLKKTIKATDRPVRIVPNKSLELSSAQVLHNKLFTSHNWELILLRDGNETYLAQTTNVQDIDAYAARDQARPARDAKVGMLPPKLAQTIINLAVGQIKKIEDRGQENEEKNPQSSIPHPLSVFDPFCGTGVILQEALLMGYQVTGTDLDARMVEYARRNMDWLQQKWKVEGGRWKVAGGKWKVENGDATDYSWPALSASGSRLSATIACETYLGRPFSSAPDHATLQKVMRDVDTIHEKFLKNVASQTESGFRMCLAVPAWARHRQQTTDNRQQTFRHLPVLEKLNELGYTRLSFAHARNEELIYHREGQIVGRELVVLKRT
ncbi:MAG: hypothetical protein U5L95_00485 [Candidatus Saccharibacteria bacterium]|nr:hypothetical protein [Candidatus Saccharibacteria bacterium]